MGSRPSAVCPHFPPTLHPGWLPPFPNRHPSLGSPEPLCCPPAHLVLTISGLCQPCSPLPYPSKSFPLGWLNYHFLLPSETTSACPSLFLLLTSTGPKIVPQKTWHILVWFRVCCLFQLHWFIHFLVNIWITFCLPNTVLGC